MAAEEGLWLRRNSKSSDEEEELDGLWVVGLIRFL